MAVSKIDKLKAVEVDTVNDALDKLPYNMRIFSLLMRSLYAENAVSAKADGGKDFIKLRDEVRQDAMIYLDGVMPLAIKLVRSINGFFDNYDFLDYEEWKEGLPDIIKEVAGQRQCCEFIVKVHVTIMKKFKQKEDRAKVLLVKLKDLSEELEKEIAALKADAAESNWWAKMLSFVPGVNAIATPLLAADASSQLAKATARSKQVEINNTAAIIVTEAMIPAISAFVDGMRATAGFFKALEQKLTGFQEMGEAAMDVESRVHYKKMKGKAREIKGNCEKFFAVTPDIESDFKAIQYTQSNKNYVDEWLEKEVGKIRKEFEADARNPVTGQLRKLLASIKGVGA